MILPCQSYTLAFSPMVPCVLASFPATTQAPLTKPGPKKLAAKAQRPWRGLSSYRRLRCSQEPQASTESDLPASTVSVSGDGGAEVKDKIRAGRETYNPQSYESLVEDATSAALRSIKDGEKRIEVQFPLPGAADLYKISADESIDANIQLALAAATQMSEAGRKVRIVLADTIELDGAKERYQYSLEVAEKVTIGHTQEGMGVLGSLFGGTREVPADAEAADTFLVINHSTIELPELEKYVNDVANDNDKVVVLWNLELETLRADLGLLGFPSRDLQYRFLSQFLPAFFLRKRDYSKTITVPPFLVNYTGILLREYPADWQVMLQQDDGSYACIAENEMRFTLFNVKEELLEATGLNTEEKGSAMEFLRKGYKRSTWWEDSYDEEESKQWRS